MPHRNTSPALHGRFNSVGHKKSEPIMERTSKLRTNEHDRPTSTIRRKQTPRGRLLTHLPLVYGFLGARRVRR